MICHQCFQQKLSYIPLPTTTGTSTASHLEQPEQWAGRGLPSTGRTSKAAQCLPTTDAVGPLLWKKQFSDNHHWSCIIITVKSAALDRSCGDTAVNFYEEELDLLHQHGQERLSVGVKGISKCGGTVGELRSHLTWWAGPATSKGGIPGLSKGLSITILRVRVILMPSLLLDLRFIGHFIHKVPSGWNLDEGAWSCPRGHPSGRVAHNPSGRHLMSG